MLTETLVIIGTPVMVLIVIALVAVERQVVAIHDRIADLESKMAGIELEDPVEELQAEAAKKKERRMGESKPK